MKVLITGGYGFLGTHVAEKLRSAGHELILTSRRRREECRPGVECWQLDLADPRQLSELPDVAAAVHTAALIPETPGEAGDYQRLWEVNALGTIHILNWARERGVEKVVYSSSMSVYAADAPLPVKEDARTYPTGRSSIYGLSKLAGEIFAETFSQERGGGIFSLRFSSVYGGGMRSREVLSIFVARARAGETLHVNASQASGDFLYAKDAAAAVQAALESSCGGGIFNIGSGIETTLLKLARTVCEELNGPTNPVIQVNQGGTGRRFCMDISKARRELGFEPQFTLRAGLADWLRPEGCKV